MIIILGSINEKLTETTYFAFRFLQKCHFKELCIDNYLIDLHVMCTCVSS